MQKALYRAIIRPLTVKAAIGLFVKDIVGSENIPKKGGAVVVANHSSYLDFIIIPSVITRKTKRRPCILAAEELAKHPVLGVFARNDNCILLNRNKLGNVIEADFFKKGIRALRGGELLLVFPEGTRSLDGSIRPWKLGFLKLAIAARVPIIPIAIKGTFDILPKGSAFPKLGRKCSVTIERPVVLSACYGKRQEKADLAEIADSVKKKVVRNLAK